MSHGTLVTITFYGAAEYPTVAAIAARHLNRIRSSLPANAFVNVRRHMEAYEAIEYLQTLADRTINVPSARYPNPPIVYGTAVHHCIEEEFTQLLLPFFKELLESEGDDTPNCSTNIVLMFENEHGPLEAMVIGQIEPGSNTELKIEKYELPFKHHPY